MFLTHDGDLRNLVNNDGPGKGREALALAVQKGARTLDCFAGFLPNVYARVGFVETGRMKFDPDYARMVGGMILIYSVSLMLCSCPGRDMNTTSNAMPYQPSSRYYSGDQFDKAKEESLHASHD